MYHVQYFGSQASRGWTNIGMVFPFEGYSKFHEKILNETKDLPKKQANKIFAKYSIRPGLKKQWNESVSEAEEALKLNLEDRVEKLTFNYVVRSDTNETKKRPSSTKRSLESSELNNSLASSSSKKPNNAPEDVYNFDEDSEGFNNGLPGLSFPKRALKGDFQVYIRKHFDGVSKENPDLSKAEVTDILRNNWDSLDEEMRSIYVERKAIYEDESNMLVSKRSNFEDNYFNDDDSDYDYNDSDNSNQNGFDQPKALFPVTPKDTKKSESLFDKIKNEVPKKASNGKDSRSRKSSVSRSSITNSSKKKSVTTSTEKVASKEKTPTSQKSSVNLNTPKSKISIVKRMLIESDESGDDANNVVDLKNPFKSDIFCYQCADEENINDERIKCKGECGRIFHKKCASYEGSNNTFVCSDCFNSKCYITIIFTKSSLSNCFV